MNLRTRRRYTGPSANTLLLLEDRSRGRCELCGEAAVHTHHRRPRGMGSSRDEATNAASNLLRLCLDCHAGIESRRAEPLASVTGSLLASIRDRIRDDDMSKPLGFEWPAVKS